MELRSIYILTSVICGVGGINVIIPQKQYQYHKGDNITIPCQFRSKILLPSLVIITWSVLRFKNSEWFSYGPECSPYNNRMRFLERAPGSTKTTCKPSCCENTPILGHYLIPEPETKIYQLEYEGRVSVEMTRSEVAEFKLLNVTVRDNVFLMCRVQIPEDDEGNLEAVTQLIIYSPPSPPVCEVEGKVEQGQSLTLSCDSEESFPPAVYSWKSPDALDQNRAKQNKTRNGRFLFLNNITKDMSGLYICTSRNLMSSVFDIDTCNITLSVKPASVSSVSASDLSVCSVRIIATVTGFLIIGIVVIYYHFCKIKKRQNEEGAVYEFMNAVVME